VITTTDPYLLACLWTAPVDQVDAHEMYCTQLQRRVEELRPLLTKIAKREAVVQTRVELESLKSNPERLKAKDSKAFETR